MPSRQFGRAKVVDENTAFKTGVLATNQTHVTCVNAKSSRAQSTIDRGASSAKLVSSS
jgi:hypothetical protein